MNDYDLTGLSPRSFEQMIQALSCSIIGPGVVIFGDGPDGGREATYKGRLSNFPSSAECWDGYLVIQVKFCQRPKSKPKDNEKWLVKQLKNELDAFSAQKTKRKKPHYYIFATNVILSSVQDRGGKDVIFKLISKYQKKIGLKDYRIWDYDQICRYLDANESIRHAYGAWITPGDVLAKLISTIDGTTPDFEKIMVNFLQKEILDDQYSKLEQAGHSPEDRIPLEKVFIDLPAFNERCSEAPEEKSSQDLLPGFLVDVLDTGSLCLKPEEAITTSERQETIGSTKTTELGRYVLVGGPGQGKSTLSQFLCQIQRACILKDRSGLDPDVRKAVQSIVDTCTSQQLPWQVAKRFPVRIELARFAKALASQVETKVNSILSYTSTLIKERTNYEISVDALRNWLEQYPWLLILDGLDEVPASSNRDQVLIAVRDFLVDISSCNADVLVLATTRPQGYNTEFSRRRYKHRWLAPLSVHRALHYGKTLVEINYSHDSQRKTEILSRLENASKIMATAKLMESPLQVTIMARLLAQVAQPPQERYKLFQQYYKIIYRREMERGVETLSQLLRDHETDIDAIHHHTGLLLQIESERTRHTDATLSIEDFKMIVSDRLSNEGHSGEKLDTLINAITTCATDRLVFLVPSQSERFGFEIRSLQEFMAADAMMNGADEVVINRLKIIASVPFWENVFLFAAGKCFAERQWLRDSVAQVCSELNDDPQDNVAHMVMAGSRIALSLLEDGPARRQPAYAQTLARRALTLLSLPPDSIHERLASIYEPAFETVFQEELEQNISTVNIANKLSSWKILFKLISDKNIQWAKDLAEPLWSQHINDGNLLLDSVDAPIKLRWLVEKYSDIFFQVPGPFQYQYFYDSDTNFRELFPNNKLASHFLSLERSSVQYRKSFFTCGVDISVDLNISFLPLNESNRILAQFSTLQKYHDYYKLLIESARFALHPSCNALANTLRSLISYYKSGYSIYSEVVPWPLLTCLMSVNSVEDIEPLAVRAEQGEMGDVPDWLAAEKRWKLKGVTIEDLSCMTNDNWPIPKSIRECGFPIIGTRIYFNMQSDQIENVYKNIWKNITGEKAKSYLAHIIIYYIYGRSHHKTNMPNAFRSQFLIELLESTNKFSYLDYEMLESIYIDFKENKIAPEIFNRLGDSSMTHYIFRRRSHQGVLEENFLSDLKVNLCGWLEERPERLGLLNILSTLAQYEFIDKVPSVIWANINSANMSKTPSALILQLANKRLTSDDFEKIAEKCLPLFNEKEQLIYKALRVLRNHQMENKSCYVFLEIMLIKLPPSFYRARNYVISLLLDLLGRRVAPLCEDQVWSDLNLPPGLLKLTKT